MFVCSRKDLRKSKDGPSEVLSLPLMEGDRLRKVRPNR